MAGNLVDAQVAGEEPRQCRTCSSSTRRRGRCTPRATFRARSAWTSSPWSSSACATCRSSEVEKVYQALGIGHGQEGRDLRPGRHLVRAAALLLAALPRLPDEEPLHPRRRHRQVAGGWACRSRRTPTPAPKAGTFRITKINEAERTRARGARDRLRRPRGPRAASMRWGSSTTTGRPQFFNKRRPHPQCRLDARRGLLQRRQDVQVARGDQADARALRDPPGAGGPFALRRRRRGGRAVLRAQVRRGPLRR